MKEVSLDEFRWLYDNHLKYRRKKCWTITSQRKKAKRRKYYVMDKDAERAYKYTEGKIIT